MISLAIYGTGACAQKLTKYLNKNTVKCFIETNPKKDVFESKKVFSLSDLIQGNIKYDYLVIASSFRDEILQSLKINGVVDSNIIIFDENYIRYFYSQEELTFRINHLQESMYDVIALGLSYTRDGINSDFFNVKTMNLSYSSQDLFADYTILSYLNERKLLKSIKHVILGLGYYSFHHDMSKTRTRDAVKRYLKLSSQNREYAITEEYICFENLLGPYLKELNGESLIEAVANADFYKELKENQLAEGVEMATKHSIMNHPQTREENLIHFEGILKIINDNKLNLLIIIFPTDENYYLNITEECKNNFYNDINKFKRKFDFSIIDELKSDMFTTKDFWDTSHLNFNGSKKMAKLLSPYLK